MTDATVKTAGKINKAKAAKGASPKGKPAAKVAKKGAARAKGTSTLRPDDGRFAPYRFTDEMAIKAKAKENPYREETDAHKWYAIALKAGTVGKFKTAIAQNKADPKAKFPFDHLRIARRSGHLTVGGK